MKYERGNQYKDMTHLKRSERQDCNNVTQTLIVNMASISHRKPKLLHIIDLLNTALMPSVPPHTRARMHARTRTYTDAHTHINYVYIYI